MGVGSIRFYGRILNSLFEMVLEEMTRDRKSFPCSRPTGHNRAIRFQDHRVSLVVQLCRTVLRSTNDKNLSGKTHLTLCRVAAQTFQHLTLHFTRLFSR